MFRALLPLTLLPLLACGSSEPAAPPASPAATEQAAEQAAPSPAAAEEAAAVVMYTCPMHPEVMQDEPGSCPKCGMDLVKAEEHDHTSHDHGEMKTGDMEH